MRVVALFVGLSFFSVSIVSMLESGLGLPPWDVFHQGIALHTPFTLGQATIVVGVVILGVSWVLGQPPGFGTVANAIVIGLGVDLLADLAWVQGLADAALPARIGLLAAGIVLMGVGSALYIGAGLGAGPRDSLMLAITHRTRWRIGLVRAAIEITVLLIGVALGGTVGIGTLAMALLIGPVVEASFWSVQALGLARERVATEFDPIDAA